MGLFDIDKDRLADARVRLLAEIDANAGETANWTGRSKFSGAVMAAMAKVPRHEFVRPGDIVAAYVNRPQSIGHGQTISQPYIVALMTDLLDLEKSSRVLEIGTGSGYQTAVLAELAGKVFSIERVDKLARPVRDRLAGMGYDNVEVRSGDGFDGWPDQSPFDAIIVTAAPERIPEALTEQLAAGGRMIIPLGRAHATQHLTLVNKGVDGTLSERAMLPVSFVPMLPKKS